MSGTHFDLRQRHPACLHLLACSCAHVNIDSCMASICWQPTRLTQCHPHLSCPAGWVAYLGAANAGIPLSIIVKDYGWGAYFTGGLRRWEGLGCLPMPWHRCTEHAAPSSDARLLGSLQARARRRLPAPPTPCSPCSAAGGVRGGGGAAGPHDQRQVVHPGALPLIQAGGPGS